MAAKAVEERSIGCVLGCLVGDAAGVGAHWCYNPKKLESDIAKAKRGPAFLDPSPNPFYQLPRSGMLSCYGDQTLDLLKSLAACGKYDGNDYAARLAVTFGKESEYEVKEAVDQNNWPELKKDAKQPIPGPWRHASIKGFLANYVNKGVKDPTKCGSGDEQIDSACKVAPIVARYAGHPDMRKFAEAAVRVTQNTDVAARWGVAFADVLESIVLGQAKTVGEALEAGAKKADANGDDELADYLRRSLPEGDLAGLGGGTAGLDAVGRRFQNKAPFGLS